MMYVNVDKNNYHWMTFNIFCLPRDRSIGVGWNVKIRLRWSVNILVDESHAKKV